MRDPFRHRPIFRLCPAHAYRVIAQKTLVGNSAPRVADLTGLPQSSAHGDL
jgi:hypothetical protein